jgi:hypothetical protein
LHYRFRQAVIIEIGDSLDVAHVSETHFLAVENHGIKVIIFAADVLVGFQAACRLIREDQFIE